MDTEEDDTFDRALAGMLREPGDSDVALLSRSVMSALGDGGAGQGAGLPARELAHEPLPWAAGLGGLLLLGAGLGYALLPRLAGDELLVIFALRDLASALGGL
ncbi:hypothetical protein [Mangrovicoccus sp. HB161399]|uniref:hypothetical protein n=1 Tax=Mangrovicoccus sp. HB161399 TaxID=2720392 RepID=UPI00155496D8|nr:hypothetical protein [Mangrovicoccus sp. HB161399]